MKCFTCIEKVTNSNGEIISYVLQDYTLKKLAVSKQKLITLLSNNQISVTNLAINNNSIEDKAVSEIDTLIAKAKLVGGSAKEIKSICGNSYYLIDLNNTSILYFPDDVETWNTENQNEMPDYLHCESPLIVIGGKGLKSADRMFYSCRTESIDLTGFDTSSIHSMRNMFYGVKLGSLDLSGFNTSNVTDMSGMFSGATIGKLNLSSFDTSRVSSMRHMFASLVTKDLDLSNFDTSHVTTMETMFLGTVADTLDISSFDTRNVTKMNQMFSYCRIPKIDVSILNTDKAETMAKMFYESNTPNTDLSALKIPSKAVSRAIFANCIATYPQVMSGVTLCVTGAVHSFDNRDSLERLIVKLGGKLAKSISKKVNYLVTNNKYSGSRKNVMANQLGIPVISESELLDMYDLSKFI